MKVLLIDNGSSYLVQLKTLIHPSKTISWDKLNKNFKSYDLVIISGGHHQSIIHHSQAYADEIQLIKHIKQPIIGICLGSELLAHIFGARLSLLKHKQHRVRRIKDLASGKTFRVYESHRWAITRLPKQLIKLATSKDGVEIFRHKTRPIYGLQFHPEMLINKNDGHKLFQSILNGLRE